MTHRRVGKLIGSLREGSKLHEPPMGLKEKGVVWIAVHPKDSPQLITAWGIEPLEFIKGPEPVMVPVPSHSIITSRTPVGGRNPK